MKAIVRTCWEICLLRKGPQVFPHSWSLFVIMLVAYLVTDGILFVAQGLRGLDIVIETLCDTALQLVFFVLVLGIWRKLARFNQTASALLGTGSIIMLAAVPLSFAATLLPASPAVDVVRVLLYGILAWSILVMGYISRHALDTGLTIGIVIAGTYTLLNLVLFAVFFPIKG
ncbi:MAG: hypothetical protein ACRESE_03470 [Gammaproteobacteria bacterium]